MGAKQQPLRRYGTASVASRPDRVMGVGATHSTDEIGEPARWDPVEGRSGQPSEPYEGNMTGAQEPEVMSTKQVRIASLAERFPQRAFTSLSHHIDAQWLKTAYLMTRHDGAVGIDGQ